MWYRGGSSRWSPHARVMSMLIPAAYQCRASRYATEALCQCTMLAYTLNASAAEPWSPKAKSRTAQIKPFVQCACTVRVTVNRMSSHEHQKPRHRCYAHSDRMRVACTDSVRNAAITEVPWSQA